LTTCTPWQPIFHDSGSSVQDTNRCDYIDQNVCPSFQELRTELPHKFVGKVRPMILRKTLVDIQPNYHHKRYLHETKEKTKTRLISKLSTNLNSNQVLQNSAAYTLYD